MAAFPGQHDKPDRAQELAREVCTKAAVCDEHGGPRCICADVEYAIRQRERELVEELATHLETLNDHEYLNFDVREYGASLAHNNEPNHSKTSLRQGRMDP